MHTIKSIARKEAWYGNNFGKDPQDRTYNFFGRVNTRLRAPTDIEQGAGQGAGLRPVQTESNASPMEGRRRSENMADNTHYQTQRSSTYAQGNSRELPLESDRSEDITSETSNTVNGDSTKSPTGPESKRSEPSGVIEESAGGARKRKMRKFMLCASKDDPEDPDVKRTDTSESKKKRGKFNQKIPFMSQFKAVFGSWINILLVFVPVGIAVNFAQSNGVVTFVLNFVAIVPLAAMLSFATEELAMYIGETLGGLLNATFGNAVELIVSIIALVKDEIVIVQTSLIGSMLSNLLLVLGMCFFFGGLRREEQFFNITVAQTAASLLALAIGSLIIPTVFWIVIHGRPNVEDQQAADKNVPLVSRGTSIMLLVTYACYLIFQLKTHVEMYNEPSKKVPKKPTGKKDPGEMLKGLATIGAGTGAAAAGGQINQENLVQEQEDEEETPQLSIVGALVTLAGSTVLIAVCAEFMVDGIGAVSQSVSQEFIGLILLPIVGNAAEHATAVTVAVKDKMDLSIGVAVGSSLQIALLVIPITVLLSWWGVGMSVPNAEPMTLNFDGFLIAVLFISIILVNYLIQDGKSHWLEGVMLQITYLIIAVAAWFYPQHANLAG